eukprot:7377786-Prymnesium_polylepis.2
MRNELTLEGYAIESMSVVWLETCTLSSRSERGLPAVKLRCHPKPPRVPVTCPLRVSGSAVPRPPPNPQWLTKPTGVHATPIWPLAHAVLPVAPCAAASHTRLREPSSRAPRRSHIHSAASALCTQPESRCHHSPASAMADAITVGLPVPLALPSASSQDDIRSDTVELIPLLSDLPLSATQFFMRKRRPHCSYRTFEVACMNSGTC